MLALKEGKDNLLAENLDNSYIKRLAKYNTSRNWQQIYFIVFK